VNLSLQTVLSLLGIAGGLWAAVSWVFRRGAQASRIEKATEAIEAAAERISSIPQLREDITVLSSRVGSLHSDFRELDKRVAVIDARKISKDNIPALRPPSRPEWFPGEEDR
jgi:hypothetical protein